MDTDMGTPETQPRKPVWDIISSSSSLAPARSTASRLGTALPLARWRDCEGGVVTDLDALTLPPLVRARASIRARAHLLNKLSSILAAVGMSFFLPSSIAMVRA